MLDFTSDTPIIFLLPLAIGHVDLYASIRTVAIFFFLEASNSL